MTLQEKELLTRFLQQLESARATDKDAEAEALIRQACARQPDTAYLLVQRAIQLEQLLQGSHSEVQKLRGELEQGRPETRRGFLNDHAWGARADTAPSALSGQRATASPARAGSWSSGLFGNIAATAAGVIAGSFLFQGIQGLMNRDEASASDTLAPDALQHAQSDEPELLNSFDTPESDMSETTVSDAGDLSDFG